MNYDKQSFLAGVSVGMKLKGVTGGRGSGGEEKPNGLKSAVIIPVTFSEATD